MPEIADSLIETIVQRLQHEKRVRRTLPGGRLHIDRPVPFLTAYRSPTDREDPGTKRLVVGEGSYLAVSGDSETLPSLQRLVLGVSDVLVEKFGAVLIVELWSGTKVTDAIVGGALVARPCFEVFVPGQESGRATAAALVRALRRIRILGQRTRIEIRHDGPPAPPGMAQLLTERDAARLGALSLGLKIPPIYQEPATGTVYPRVLRRLHRELSRALQRTYFRFAHLETPHRPAHFQSLGPQRLLRAIREADEQLSVISSELNLLMAVTPVNSEAAYAEFAAGGYAKQPTFHYRLLNFDPDVLKRRLYGISLEVVDDPAIGELLRDKREELDRQVTLLHDRNTERFLYGSLQLYGGVEADLAETARQVLAAPRPDSPPDEFVGAEEFAERARREIEAYREMDPALEATVEVRDDVPSLIVSRGKLMVGQGLRVGSRRVEALIHHEIGTHVLTWHNAVVSPLKLLAAGMPGYEPLQEGTAVMAEHLVGGLSPGRLRLLAARVVAVQRRIEGRSFAEVFGELNEAHGFGQQSAFTTTMRVFRGGGFTKDAVYLRGLVYLLKYLARGGELELLFLGKVSQASLPIVRELRWREVLGDPPLRPRYLEAPGAAERLEHLRRGATVMNLIAPMRKAL